MKKLYAKHDTFLKSRIEQSVELKHTEKYALKTGDSILVKDISPVEYQHVKIEFNKKTSILGETYKFLYAYRPHVRIEVLDSPDLLKMNVPYYTQHDNNTEYFGPGYRQCNLSCNAMYLAYLKPIVQEHAKQKGFETVEDYYGFKLNKYGDTTDHQAHTKALGDFGVETYFSYSLSLEDLLKSLEKKIPMVMGVKYKIGGHMIIATGYNKDKECIYVHDPYGVRFGSSDMYEVGANGAYDEYSYDLLKHIWVDMGDEAGWGRVLNKVT